jgi:hypothetical protein
MREFFRGCLIFVTLVAVGTRAHAGNLDAYLMTMTSEGGAIPGGKTTPTMSTN